MFRKIELIFFLLLVAGFVLLNRNLGKPVVSEDISMERKTVVLDAGHGGKDPGKVGTNGVLEKDINLKISEKVKEYLELKGIEVIMTRENDEMCGGHNESKSEDMKKRVDIINEIKPDLAVSIHQNSYTDPSVKGAQTFYYSESEEGRRIAEIIQSNLLGFDKENHRQAKANDNYYLLTKTKVPTVIVECGFLSNQREAEKLADEDYQDQISKVIVDGIESCFVN